MKYGYFDNENREYVITNPATPAPWVNYLGSPEYGAIISNNAGGYSFAKSGANGRILRYVFNNFDQPGRYIYIRDDRSSDFWSASWQPAGKDLAQYKSECRHGIGYTKISADYSDIHSEALYYVPLGKSYEVWALSVTNHSDHERNLTLSGYAEFTNHSNYEQDQVNLQYSLFISRTLFEGNRITQQIHGNLDAIPENENVDEKNVTERFFGLAGAEVSSYCGDKNEFLGSYHGYGNPEGIVCGDLGDKTSYNENSCGALSCKITLKAGETRTIAFLLGMATTIICQLIPSSLGEMFYHRDDLGLYIRLSSISAPIFFVSNTMVGILNGLNRQSIILRNSIIVSVTEILSLYFFTAIPSINIFSYVITIFVTSTLNLIINLHEIKKHIELNLSLFNIIIFILTGILVYLMLNLFTNRLLDGLFISKNIIVIVLTFGIFAYLSRFGLEED